MNAIEINVSPILFSFGNVEVRWYGAMMALGVTALMFWTYMQIKRGAKISYDDLLSGAIIGIICGIVFSRLLHVFDGVENIRRYFSNPTSIIGGDGLTIYGAILGASLGVWVFSRMRKLSFAYAADVVTPGIIMAQAIGRVGCLFNGCCFGDGIEGNPFNIMYTNPQSYAPIGVVFQPTQVYEILFLLALLTIIMVFRSRFKPNGVQFMFYLGMYSIWRIGIGFLRVGPPGLAQAQFIGIIVSSICAVGIYLAIRRDRAQAAAETSKENLPETGSDG
ncbi:MAG: prolipoprotein diacylglyceryl transferase [Dehalococcoidia bacterium]|nr:prolipoprotein diacylglyceryl transferase [Dehalococcoidia bacterium]